MVNNLTSYKCFIYAIIKKIIGEYNEDLAQDAYIKILQNENHYENIGKEKAWIGCVISNVCKDYLKSKLHKQSHKTIGGEKLDHIGVVPQYEERISKKERQKIILNAVDSLPKDLRQVLYLYEFEENSYIDIAKKLKISEGTVKSRLYNARRILSEKLNFLKGENK